MKTMILALCAFSITIAASAAVPVAPAPPATIRGVVISVKGGTLTLLKGMTIDASAAKITRRRAATTVDAIAPGSQITATISGVDSIGGLLADSVIVDPADATITGRIQAVSSSSVTVLGQTVALSPDTAFGGFNAGVAIAKSADLKPDMPVAVDVVMASDGGIAAVRVTAVGPAPPAPPRPQASAASVTGTVSSAGKNSWTVAGTTVYIAPQTTISGSPVIGDLVVVRGLKTAEGAIIAASITKQ